MKASAIKARSDAFAVRIVRLFRWLCQTKKEFVLSRQILRSGTPIVATVEESGGSFSEKAFAAKIQIAFKEALETRFGLRLLHVTTDHIGSPSFASIAQAATSLFAFSTQSQERCGRNTPQSTYHSIPTATPVLRLLLSPTPYS